MFESLKKAIDEIFGSVIRPIKEWILRQSWGVRTICLVVIAAAAFAWWKPQTVSGMYQQSRFYWRSWHGDSGKLPLSRSAQQALALALGRLTPGVEADLDTEGDNPASPITPWSASQSVLALQSIGRPIADKDSYVAYVNKGRFVPDCFCWTERVDDPRSDVSSFISGWVMTAFAGLGVPLASPDYDYVLHVQNGAGWWPMFPESGAAKYPSTYATGWMALGLYRQRATGLVPPEKRAAVDRAILRARLWLMHSREGARWQAHPGAPASETLDAVSAFALHVLHQIGGADLSDVDRAWLDALPTQNLQPTSRDNHYIELPYGSRSNIDRISDVRLPWVLLATADAYGSGTTAQKARTLNWIEKVLRDPSVRNADTQGFDWMRAELLLGLAETSKHTDCPACKTDGSEAKRDE